MNKRNEHARICQGGASNQRLIAGCLVEAIDECRAEGVSMKADPAVYLILHQLVYVLTGSDIAGHDRYTAAMSAVEAP